MNAYDWYVDTVVSACAAVTGAKGEGKVACAVPVVGLPVLAGAVVGALLYPRGRWVGAGVGAAVGALPVLYLYGRKGT